MRIVDSVKKMQSVPDSCEAKYQLRVQASTVPVAKLVHSSSCLELTQWWQMISLPKRTFGSCQVNWNRLSSCPTNIAAVEKSLLWNSGKPSGIEVTLPTSNDAQMPCWYVCVLKLEGFQ